MQKKSIFFLLRKNFHIHCIPRDINPSSPIVVDVNHLSIWKHFSSSHTVIASSASTPSEAGYRFRGHDTNETEQTLPNIPFRTSSFFHYLFKNRGTTLSLLVARFNNLFSSISLPLGMQQKRKNKAVSQEAMKKTED